MYKNFVRQVVSQPSRGRGRPRRLPPPGPRTAPRSPRRPAFLGICDRPPGHYQHPVVDHDLVAHLGGHVFRAGRLHRAPEQALERRCHDLDDPPGAGLRAFSTRPCFLPARSLPCLRARRILPRRRACPARPPALAFDATLALMIGSAPSFLHSEKFSRVSLPSSDPAQISGSGESPRSTASRRAPASAPVFFSPRSGGIARSMESPLAAVAIPSLSETFARSACAAWCGRARPLFRARLRPGPRTRGATACTGSVSRRPS